jgi:hypothetical protein
MSTNTEFANIYYKSASSWKAQIDKDTVVYYDDNVSGKPGDAEVFAGEYTSHMLGAPQDGTVVPMFDSMRIGKGERVPFSAFVKLAGGSFHQEILAGSDVSLRPLNPEYVKTGKNKLAWGGPKPTQPVQLIVQGRGDYATAYFDVSGKGDVEVPAGEYKVIFGRILNGKGARAKMAAIYPGERTETFLVEAGKTFTLEMGAPFQLAFTRDGDENTSIDAAKIHVEEKAGCILSEWHGWSLDCEVMAAKDDTGKGAKEVGGFMPFTDPELVNKAAGVYKNLGLLAACFPMPKGYQSGELVLSIKVSAGSKIALVQKKHDLFGKLLEPVWK